jgi:hypothetical protein
MLDEVTLEVIDGVKTEKLKTSGKATVNRYLALVRALLLRARDEWEWIERAPKVKLFIEGPGRERSITPEQVVALPCELPTHQRDVVIFALQRSAAVQRARTGVFVRGPGSRSRLGLCRSIQESQANRGALECYGA